MATNRSLNKIRVTRLFGAGAAKGLLDPQVNMLVKHQQDPRWIVGLDSGNYQISLALASGGAACAKAYPHECYIDEPVASGYGWPTSDDSVLFGHDGGINASGPPVIQGTGMWFVDGGGTPTGFCRPFDD